MSYSFFRSLDYAFGAQDVIQVLESAYQKVMR